jgi:hypothetical protein
MFNITLLCTHHSVIGKCNADELFKIIESIEPNVIFEELPPEHFDLIYNQNIPFESPEVNAVRKYIENYSAKHFPVDIEVDAILSDDEIDHMFNTFKLYPFYNQMEQEQKILMYQQGYNFLNSLRCEDLFQTKKNLEQNLIDAQPYRNQLNKTYKLFYKQMDVREHQIVKNIYAYSEQVSYNQAILLLGSGHRKTIFEKVKDFNTNSRLKLNWALWESAPC